MKNRSFITVIITAITNAFVSLFKLLKHESKKNDDPETVWDCPRITGATKFIVKLHKDSIKILKNKHIFTEEVKGNPIDIVYDVEYEPVSADPETRENWAKTDHDYQNFLDIMFKSFDAINVFQDPEYLNVIKALFNRHEPCYIELQDIIRPYLARYNVTL